MASLPETVQGPSTLGERVRAARRELGMSQAQLAGGELTKGFISQVEAGLVRPSVRSLQIMANRLGRSLDYFLGDEPLAAMKRLTFHRLAAEAAVERHDWDTVRAEVARGLGERPQPREHAKLLRFLAQAEITSGDREAAFEHIARGLGMVTAAAEPIEVAHLLYLRGLAYGQQGHYVAAGEALEAARDVVEKYELTDPRLRARILVSLGTAYRRLRRTTKAAQTYASALSLASSVDELRLAAQGYMGIAVSLYDSGELDGAIANYQRALDLFERVSDTGFELSVLHSLASVHLEHGDMQQSADLAQRCAARARAVGDKRMSAVAEVVLARIALAANDAAGALRLAQGAERILEDVGDAVQRADALRVIGSANDAIGDYEASDQGYRKSIELLTASGDSPDLSAFAAEYARKLRVRGKVDEAFDLLELARQGAPKT